MLSVRGIGRGLTDTPSRFAAGFLAAAIAVLGIGLFVSTPWQIAGDKAMRERIALARAQSALTQSALTKSAPITSNISSRSRLLSVFAWKFIGGLVGVGFG